MMCRISVFYFAGLIAFVSGCIPPDGFFELSHDGLTRQYYVHVPSSDDGDPLPLVLNFHGGGGSAEGHRDMTGMNASADQEGYMVVYPRGMRVDGDTSQPFQRFWNIGDGPNGEFNSNPAISELDDVGFVDALLDDVNSRFSVDANRVYATGFSNGGVLDHLLACALSNRVAAIASISGPFWTDPEQCSPGRAVSVMHFHGTGDECAPYDGGPSGCESGIAGEGRVFVSAQESVDIWREKNNCPAAADVTYENGEVTCETWGPCDAESEVVLCTVAGGGHTWPGGRGYFIPGIEIGPVTKDISANDAMWDFFQKHPLE
jgi:polyhydroxybutyrate depolymerase